MKPFDFLPFWTKHKGKLKAVKARRAFEKIDKILDGDTGGWQSEEDIAEEIMADRRAARNHFSPLPVRGVPLLQR